MTAASIIILILWDAGLVWALWVVATKLHEDMHLGVTPTGDIARHLLLGMGLFVALLSVWPQAVVIAAVSLSVYVTWGALLAVRKMPHSDQTPRDVPRAAWPHVSGGTSQHPREPQ